MKNFFKDLIDVRKYKREANTWENKYSTLEYDYNILNDKYVKLLEEKSANDYNVNERMKKVFRDIKEIKERVSDLETKKRGKK